MEGQEGNREAPKQTRKRRRVPEGYGAVLPECDPKRRKLVARKVSKTCDALVDAARKTGLEYVIVTYDPATSRVKSSHSRLLERVWGETNVDMWIPALYAHNLHIHRMQKAVFDASTHVWAPLEFDDLPGGREVREKVATCLVALMNPYAFEKGPLGKDSEEFKEMRWVSRS